MKNLSIHVAALTVSFLALSYPSPAQAQDAPFSFEVVDSEGAGPSAFIALDRDGKPHVGYVDPVRWKLRYAFRTEGGWRAEDVTDSRGEDCRFTVSADGRPFFIFWGPASALRDDAGWHVSSLETYCIGWTVGATDLGAGPDGSVHMVTQQSCSGGIYYGEVSYAIWADRWVESSVAGEGLGLSGTASIAAHTAAEPHISSWNNLTGSVDYFKKAAGAWVKETIGRSSPGSIGLSRSANSIALDADGVPYVAYFDAANKDLRFGVRGPTGWTTEAVDSEGDVGRSCSLGVAPDGSVHIAYFDATHGQVKYAKRAPGATEWNIRVVASQGLLAENVDLALDVLGNVHIIYYDRARGALLYATTRKRVAIQPASWSWVRSRFR